MAQEEIRFHAADYAVFIISLVASGSVGVVQGIFDQIRMRKNKQENTGVSERNLSVWPASLSVMASCMAAPFVLGIPAEMFTYGTEFSLIVIGYLIGVPLMTQFFYVRFYRMEITSVYEYLEFRFSKALRSLCTAIFAVSMIVYMGIITYAPALALTQVTGIPMDLSILGVGLIGILYTTVGGLKGVIWVDAIQMLIILAGVIAIIVKGTIDVGGISTVWQLSRNHSRIEFDEFSLNPTTRHTFWTQSIGGSITLMILFSNQAIVQKFLSLPTERQMIVTSYISLVAIVGYLLLFCFAGVVIYAYYAYCSPMKTGQVMSSDQLVPVFVLQVFQGYYGIPGLFTASVFSASLSSLAGGINALAAVTILDVLNPLYKRKTGKKKVLS